MNMEATSSIVYIVSLSVGGVMMLAIMAVIAGVISSMRSSAVKTASLPSSNGEGRVLGESYVAKKKNQWLCAEQRNSRDSRDSRDERDQSHPEGHQLGGSGTGQSRLVKKIGVH